MAPAIVAVALLALAGCGGSGDEPAALADGQEPYLRYCGTCHGNDGGGKPPAFPPLAGSEWLQLGPEAVALIGLRGLRGEIRVAGEHYRGYMPPMRHVDDADLAGLLAFMGSAWADWERVPDADRIEDLRRNHGSGSPLEGREDLEAALAELNP